MTEWTPQNPRDALSKLDMLAMGVDATRHGLLGCVIANNNTPPNDQARNYLRSLLKSGQMTEDEFKHWWRELVMWENAGNSVNMPPPASDAQHPRYTPPPVRPAPTPAEAAETDRELAAMRQAQRDTADAISLNATPGPFLAAVAADESEGRRAPGSYDAFVAALWRKSPATAEALKLKPPTTRKRTKK
jgi:hypothetical protein